MSDETAPGNPAPGSAPALTRSSEFAGHRIEAELGRGGMGVVYRARHVALDAPRALKVIAPGLSADQIFRERFRRESRLAASIDHPNVITVHHAGEESGLLYLSMRLVDGTDLRELVEAEGAPTVRRVAGLIEAVAAGLDAAHEAGLVHRDVKPANVLIERASSGGDRVFLTDFGISRVSGGGSTVTSAGELLGSVDYVAPEQIEGGEIDKRADIYSLGCLACFTLTGQPPFPREGDLARLYAHANATRPRPSAIRMGLPRSVDAVIARAMAIKPGDRFDSAGAFAAALRDSLRDAGAEADESATRRIVTSSEPQKRRFGLRAALGLTALVVVAAIAGVLAFGGESGDDSTPADAGKLMASIPIEGTPQGLTVGKENVWVAAGKVLDAVDPKTEQPIGTPNVPGRVVAVAVDFEAAWAADRDNGGVVHVGLTKKGSNTAIPTGNNPTDVLSAYGSIWVANEDDNTVSRIDPATKKVLATIRVGSGPHALAAGDKAIWVADIDGGDVTRIEEGTNRIGSDPIDAGSQPNDLDFGGGYLWVCDVFNGNVIRIDPDTLQQVGDPIDVDARPRGLKVGFGSVWVTSSAEGTVTRIDPSDASIIGTVKVGDDPADIAIGKGSVWIANGDRTLSRIKP
jgi:YVTN family beta-propeller protein